VWAQAGTQAKTDKLSVSHITEQLLAAYVAGEFRFDGNGALVLPRPSLEQARSVLIDALQDHLADADAGADAARLADLLAQALAASGYARPE
jgi:hypothetical protein